MTFQQLKYVIDAARLGSISKAATENHIVQSSVSTEIKALEAELGITIFERHSRGVRLTSAGMELTSQACTILAYRDHIKDSISRQASESITQLSISTQRFSCTTNAMISFFRKAENENYSLRIQEGGFWDVLNSTSRGSSALGVVLLSESMYSVLINLIWGKNLQFTELKRVDQVVVLREGHPLANKKSILSEELDEYPYITFHNDTNDILESINLLGYRKPNRSIVVTDRASACAFIAGSDAYTIGSGALIRSFFNNTLVAIPLANMQNKCIIGWVKTRESEISDACLLYLKCLRDEVLNYSLY